MQEFAGWNIGNTNNLNEVGQIVLGRGKTTRDYKTYSDLIVKGEGEKIGLDCLCDAELTYDLYNHLKQYLF